jgi:hypothetical protein
MSNGLPDLDEFKRIQDEASALTERRLGPRPTTNIIPVSLLTALGAYFVLMIFSFVTGTIEHSGMVILVFVLVIGGLTYWVLRSRETKWIRTAVENEDYIRQTRLKGKGK